MWNMVFGQIMKGLCVARMLGNVRMKGGKPPTCVFLQGVGNRREGWLGSSSKTATVTQISNSDVHINLTSKLHFVCMGVLPEGMCVHHVCTVPEEAREGFGSPGTGDTDSYKTTCKSSRHHHPPLEPPDRKLNDVDKGRSSGLEVQSTSCSSKGSQFNTQHPHRG